jgi:hypothetical protein
MISNDTFSSCPVTALEAGRQWHAADGAAATIFGEPRAGQPAADHALERNHLGLTHEHRAAAEQVAINRGRQAHGINVGREQMMGLGMRTG